ncbi:hypothetical protein [Prevotella intermedia]|uniref:hypothetical protein n=1 Tax=Prevotella intermedia TaxID=28131 RepID=UPI000C1F7B2D|nr:hypothetical protein [Prevotella intermedia]
MFSTERLPKAIRKKAPLSTKTLLTYCPTPTRHNANPLKNNTIEVLKTRLNHPSILTRQQNINKKRGQPYDYPLFALQDGLEPTTP